MDNPSEAGMLPAGARLPIDRRPLRHHPLHAGQISPANVDWWDVLGLRTMDQRQLRVRCWLIEREKHVHEFRP